MLDFKIGDKVIIRKANVIDERYRNGIITAIEYNPNYSGIYFYRITGITQVNIKYINWSCNIFPHLSDEIQLDLVAIRQDKLNQLV